MLPCSDIQKKEKYFQMIADSTEESNSNAPWSYVKFDTSIVSTNRGKESNIAILSSSQKRIYYFHDIFFPFREALSWNCTIGTLLGLVTTWLP